MNHYVLIVHTVKLFGTKIHLKRDSVRFEEPSLKEASLRAKYILKEKKDDALKKLSQMFTENQISEEEMTTIKNIYPRKAELQETITHIIDIE